MGKISLFLLSIYAVLAIHVLAIQSVRSQDAPTVYEYFTSGGITSGLTADSPGHFKLNGKDIRIISGALHYFRVHPSLWRDRLKKLRATGLNTVETYVPWNLHEPQKGVFDFGNGDNDMSEFLNVRRFIQMAQEEDLLVIFRPGPYICSEWDFGGLPSWLQRDPDMKVRTGYSPYLERVKIYFDNLIPRITDLTFERGGPIIAAQIENEYASFSPIDKAYLRMIEDNYRSNGLECLYFTSDSHPNAGYSGSLEGTLLTANFQINPEDKLNELLSFQPDRPVMVMEYWSGWFDHWFEQHHTVPVAQFSQVLETIMSTYNGSVNFYMFHGVTNFGFVAGANFQGDAPIPGYAADVTSYDYDCPLSESGDYTDKYFAAQALIEKYQVPVLHRPPLIPTQPKQAYPTVTLQRYLTFADLLERVPPQSKFNLPQPVSMEMLPMNGDSGQSYGYVLYRKTVNINNGTLLKTGPVKDFVMLMVNGELQDTGSNGVGPGKRYLIDAEMETTLDVPVEGEHTIDILVENLGRVNFGLANHFLQQKGLPSGGVQLDGVEATGFEIYALEFKSRWVKGLTNWRPIGAEKVKAPALFRATLTIPGTPAETFIDMSGWTKGIVFVNGFNLGRYFEVGPQQTLYVPAGFLTTGENTIIIFEQILAGESIEFRAQPNLG